MQDQPNSSPLPTVEELFSRFERHADNQDIPVEAQALLKRVWALGAIAGATSLRDYGSLITLQELNRLTSRLFHEGLPEGTIQ